MPSTVTAPTANDVRAWAERKGLAVADRGRLPEDVVEAFNKNRKHKYVPVGRPPVRLVKAEVIKRDKAGRKRGKSEIEVSLPQIRRAAQDAGYAVGTRGRLAPSVIEAFRNGEFTVAV